MAENDKQRGPVKAGWIGATFQRPGAAGPAARPRRKWLRRLLISLGVAVVLLVVAVFYLTSAHCFRHFVVPIVEKKMGRVVLFDRVRINLFRGAEITNLSIGPKPGESQPLLKSKRIAVQWRFGALLRRRFDLPRVVADGLEVCLAERPKPPSQPPRPPSEKKEKPVGGQKGELPFLVETLNLTNCSIEFVRLGSDPNQVISRYKVRDLEIKGSHLGLGYPSVLDLQARVEASDPAQGVNLSDGAVAVNINSTVQSSGGAFSLDGTWSVAKLKGQFHGVAAQDLRATGSLIVEQSDPRHVTIRRADASVSYQGRRGADIVVTGELDRATGDGNIRVNVRRVNRAFLNLLSTPDQPLDFLGTVAEARVILESSERQNKLSVDGEMRLSDFSFVASKISPSATPLTQMTVRYKTLYDLPENKIGLERFDLKAIQEGREVVSVLLSRPMSFSFKADGAMAAETPAELTTKIDRLPLSQFNPFFDRKQVRIEGGQLTIDSTLAVAAGGQSVGARGRVDLADLRATVSGSRIARTDLGAVYDLAFNQGAFSIKALRCDVKQEGRPAGHVEGSGQISPDGQKGEIVLSGDRMDLSALQFFLAQVPSVRVRAGLVNFSQTIGIAGDKAPLRFEGRFDATGLAFDIPGRERAQFAGWTVQGDNLVQFDRAKNTAEISKLSLTANEKGVGGLQAGADGRLDLADRSGTINLAIKAIGVPFLSKVLERLGAQSDAAVRPTEGVLSGGAKLTLAKQFSDVAVQGSLSTRGMRLSVGSGGAAQSGTRDLETAYDLALTRSNARNELSVNNLTIRIPGAAAKPGSLQVQGKLDLAQNSGSLTVRLEQFDSEPVLSLFGPLAGAWRPVGGVFDGQQTIQLGGPAGETSARGTLRADRLRVAAPGAKSPIAPPTIEIQNNIALLRGGQELRADQFVIRTSQGGAPAGSLDVQGRMDLVKKSGTFTINAQNFDTDPIWPMLAGLGTDLPISGGRLNAKQNLQFALANMTIEAKGNLRADGVRVRPAPGAPAMEPLTFDLVNDIAMQPDKTDVRALRLSTYSAGKPLDQIELSATGGGLRSTKTVIASLKAPTLHVDRYLAMLSGGSGAKKAEAPKPAVPAAAKAPTAAGSKPVVIPGPPVSLSIGIGRLYYDRLILDNLLGRIGVTSEGVTFKPLTARLVDGAATVTGWLRTDIPGMGYSARINGANLSVSPLLGIISPGSEQKLTGKGTTNFEVSGRGLDGDTLKRNLRGAGTIRIVDGQIKDIPILNALAGITSVQDLADMRFFQMDGQLKIENSVIYIADVSMVGRLQKLRAKGQIGFDQKVDLTFDLWLGGELANRLGGNKILKYLKQESDRFLRLPSPIGMGGTLSKPRPTLSLPIDTILDIGIDQGFKILRDRGTKQPRGK